MSDSSSDEDQKKENLEAFKDSVDSKAFYIGFTDSPGGASRQSGDYRARKINAEDTWSGPLADDKAVEVRDTVQAVSDSFTNLSQEIQNAINNLP